MKDPHDIRKAVIEDAIIARSEERESTKNMNEPCDECGVDTVALLDERDQLRAKCERLEQERDEWKASVEAVALASKEVEATLLAVIEQSEEALFYALNDSCHSQEKIQSALNAIRSLRE